MNYFTNVWSCLIRALPQLNKYGTDDLSNHAEFQHYTSPVYSSLIYLVALFSEIIDGPMSRLFSLIISVILFAFSQLMFFQMQKIM